MEQIKVNMTPCGFTPTIHASQNDNSTRKWGFELYDEDGKIDSSSIKEQMIFDSRVGGTEQILPENTSDPTTSPIIADIQYPDSLRSEQTFFYRESPTSENGQAKITHIKGNTLVWNQLVREISFTYFSFFRCSNYTISDGVATFTASQQNGAIYQNSARFSLLNGHKYYASVQIKTSSQTNAIRFRIVSDTDGTFIFKNTEITTNWQTLSSIASASKNYSNAYVAVDDLRSSGWDEVQVKYFMLFDLTAMGLDNLSLAEVEQWFSNYYSLPYYDYTTGKLLPFKGTELKTTGKNRFNPNVVVKGRIDNGNVGYASNTTDLTINGNEISYTVNANYRGIASDFIKVNPSTLYYLKLNLQITNSSGCSAYCDAYDGGQNWIDRFSASALNVGDNSIQFTTLANCEYIRLSFQSYVPSAATLNNVIVSNANATFEPYTENTINLPTLNYFPSGMKSAGNIYDELTESKAITRIKEIENIVVTNVYQNGNYTRATVSASDVYFETNTISVNCNVATPIKHADRNTYTGDFYVFSSQGEIVFGLLTSKVGSTKQEVQTWLNNNNAELYYVTTSPTEESITTSSLVTEKGESPLYYDDELIADCNENISAENGIFDAKVKLMGDETIYSQKIQLHVERKP